MSHRTKRLTLYFSTNGMWWCQSKWHKLALTLRLSSTQDCVSSRNKYVIGLTDHNWKILGLEPKPVLKAIISTMPSHHTAAEQADRIWAGGSDSKSSHSCHQSPFDSLRLSASCDCGEGRLFISISKQGIERQQTRLTQQPIVILDSTGDGFPLVTYNRQTCQGPYLISAACQTHFPKCPAGQSKHLQQHTILGDSK